MQRVLAYLYKKQLEYELVPVNMAVRDHKKEPFLSLNPFGQVPAFKDGDLKLFDNSFRIARDAQSKVRRSESLLSLTGPFLIHLGHETIRDLLYISDPIFKPMFGMAVDSDLVTEYEAKLSQVLDVYDRVTTRAKLVLGGDCFNLADLHHLPCMQCLMGTPVKDLFYVRVHLGAWCNDLLARPAWNKVMELTNNA